MAARLRWSATETSRYTSYVRNHMRPGNLASQSHVTDKAIHRFFRDLGDDAIAMLLISLGDHLSYLTPAQKKSATRCTRKSPSKWFAATMPRGEKFCTAKILNGHDGGENAIKNKTVASGALLKTAEAQSDGQIKTKADALSRSSSSDLNTGTPATKDNDFRQLSRP